MGKGGAPLGNQNAKGRNNARQLTHAINKALRRIDRIRKVENPEYGKDPDKFDKENKKLNVIDRIATQIVLAAEKGNIQNLNILIERLEGKARQVKEHTGSVDHKHEGLTITFQSPNKAIDVTPESKKLN